MTTTKKAIHDFVKYGTCENASNLYYINHGTCDALINYATIIAIKKGDHVMINSDYYSHTTSKNTNEIKRACDLYGIRSTSMAHEQLLMEY